MTETTRPVGIIAGDGQLPVLASKRLVDRGRNLFVCFLEEHPPDQLVERADDVVQLDPARLESVPTFFLDHNVEELFLVGDVDKTSLYDEENIDDADGAVLNILENLPNKGDEYLIKAATRYLSSRGLTVKGIDTLFADQFMPYGHVGGPEPTPQIRQTIRTLKPVGRFSADREIGQTVMGKKQSVVAVEAVEGTRRVIERAGELAGESCVMLKGARSDQDTRFDVPVVGLDTLDQLASAGASALAVEADNVLWLQQEESINVAEASGISMLGFKYKSRGLLGRLKQWLSV